MTLGMPPDGKVFGANFDAVEIFNGFGAGAADADGERLDKKVELNLRDWMNFLSFGFTPTPGGNSDAHSIFQDPSGWVANYTGSGVDGRYNPAYS